MTPEQEAWVRDCLWCALGECVTLVRRTLRPLSKEASPRSRRASGVFLARCETDFGSFVNMEGLDMRPDVAKTMKMLVQIAASDDTQTVTAMTPVVHCVLMALQFFEKTYVADHAPECVKQELTSVMNTLSHIAAFIVNDNGEYDATEITKEHVLHALRYASTSAPE